MFTVFKNPKQIPCVDCEKKKHFQSALGPLMDFLLINDKAIKGLINFVKVCQVLVPMLVGT